MEFTNLNIKSFLIFALIIGFVIFILYKFISRQIKLNKRYRLLSTPKNFYIKYIFLVFAIFMLALTIFEPKGGLKNSQNELNGIDIMFVLDVSKSMNVADIKDSNYAYTRLDIAKEAVSKFVSDNIENRYGLIIFAGDAISTVPLTTDHDLFLTFLQSVDYRNLIKQGSDFYKALKLGIDRFVGDEDRAKLLVFLSDGGDAEDNVKADIIKQIKNSGPKDIAYAVIGIGTEKGGRIIISKDPFGRFSYQKYKGNYVISKINRANLKIIANGLNGQYFELYKASDLANIKKIISKLEKKAISKGRDEQKKDLKRLFSIIAFISFLIFLILYFDFLTYRKDDE